MAAIMSRIESARSQFGVAAAELDAMSPLRTLERGYAIAQNARGAIVREASAVSAGDELHVRLWKGAVDCRVEEIEQVRLHMVLRFVLRLPLNKFQ